MNLDPVQRTLIEDARRDAAEVEAAAEREATRRRAVAEDEAERLLARAIAAGTADARTAAASELARARRHARELVQAARLDAYHRLQAEARQAATRLREAPDYGALVDGLSRQARDQLGDDAVITVDTVVGGLVAGADTRTVDYRLPTIADRCIAALGTRVVRLWQ